MNHIIFDLSTAPIDGVDEFIDVEPVSAPANYKDPEKIAAYIADQTEAKRQQALDRAGLDLDLCRVTGIGLWDTTDDPTDPTVKLCRTEHEERALIAATLFALSRRDTTIVTFNGHAFDIPVLLRRCAYLGLTAPSINLDRYRTPHVDLYQKLTLNGVLKSAHALGWYVKRLGWTDLEKPLSGAEEARVHATGRWDDLAASITHDVVATARLGQWLGILPKVLEPAL